MKQTTLIPIFTALFLFPALAAQPTTAPATFPATTQSLEQQLKQLKAEEQQKYARELAGMGYQSIGKKKLGEVFSLAIDHDLLVIHPRIGGTDRGVLVEIDELTGPTQLQIGSDDPNNPEAVRNFSFLYKDFSHADEQYHLIQLLATSISVNLSCGTDGLIEESNVQLLQSYEPDESGNTAKLYVQSTSQIDNAQLVELTLSAKSFSELLRKYPSEMHHYAGPMIRQLRQESALFAPDARLSYQVFSEPDPAIKEKVDRVIAMFDADSFADRKRAAKELESLGQPAALVLTHADRTGWSIDKAGGVDSFLEQFKPLPADEIERLRKSPLFLLDCLYSEDATIRERAMARLKTIDATIQIDPTLDSAARTEAIAKLYERLAPAPATQPTTQPGAER